VSVAPAAGARVPARGRWGFLARLETTAGGTGGSLVLYLALSLALFGLHALRHPASQIVASDELDSSQFMWFFAWWPHALLHGLNPFVTHLMFVPDGFNLTWATSMPGPSLLLAPVTLAFGPAVTWNVMQLLAPALSAWTAFVLCRHITGNRRAALVGGYVFGFSPYMLIHLTGGPYLALVALLPVFVLLVLRRLEGRDGPRRFVGLMALALVAEFSISPEVLVTATLFGGFALIVAFLAYPQRRPELRRLIGLLALAYAALVVVVSPWLYFFFFGHQYPPGATFFPADLTSLVLPPSLVELAKSPHGLSGSFKGSSTESYLGLPLLAALATFAWECRRRRATWLLLASFAAAVILALGAPLVVHGHKTSVRGPWELFAQLPVLRYAIPIRLIVFALLPASVALATWLAARGGRARWILALAIVVSFLPAFDNRAWNFHISDPPFIASGEYRSYLTASDNVLTVPVWGPNERWQADTKFAFALSAGYAGNPFPSAYARYPTWKTLLTGQLTADYAAQLRRFLHDKRVTIVVVDKRAFPAPWLTLFGGLGVRPVDTGGVLIYRLRGSAASPLPGTRAS
jgi:hypothetical protein